MSSSKDVDNTVSVMIHDCLGLEQLGSNNFDIFSKCIAAEYLTSFLIEVGRYENDIAAVAVVVVVVVVDN